MPMSTAWLLNDIAEYKGKQELFSRQSPQILKALRDSATIQSAESSNRIEGVTVGHDRCTRSCSAGPLLATAPNRRSRATVVR